MSLLASPIRPSTRYSSAPLTQHSARVMKGYTGDSQLSGTRHPDRRPARLERAGRDQPRLTTRSAERTGSSSWYRHRVGARPAISSRVRAENTVESGEPVVRCLSMLS